MTEIFDNIRKLYRFYVPDNELAEYIEFFSESSAPETYRYVAGNHFTVKMFPSWTPTCYMNLGETYQLSVGVKKHLIQKDTDVLILRNTIVERHNLPTDSIFTIKFFPGGLEAILGVNQVQFKDRVVNLATILPVTLIQRVKQLGTFEERIELLQHYFLSRYYQQKKADHYRQFVSTTIGTFDESGMVLNAGQLADQLFATSKTINRYFHRVIGTPPKQYLSMVRTRAALICYVAHKDQFFPEDYGYYDMSHFYKDVVKFTGKKLRESL
ncbi:AraC family transcriptional regulator [Spirosoma sp. BT702]|uniref:AraC family transcriptional regulator n=1 Tax=Spirosoma profusum TaxID=2771354 RepID=A0A926XWY9_9BACT|nr:helix-turn-helix domain-containing protein [Spirosoma profusum]MBD2702323.1 AraC family transcriptional regulator [Spirosoma profusum]